MVLSNSPGDVKQQQQYVLTSMCWPPGGKPLALVLERGCVAKGSGGDPEMRIGYGQCGLQSSLQLFIPQWLNLSSDLSCLQKKKITHLWQLPWHLPSALKPISASHLYFSFPLPSGSSHLMRLVMRGKLWRVRLSSWETAQTVVAYELFSLESCHLGNWSASCLLLQARPQNVFQDLSTVLFGPPKYSLSLRSFQYPCGTTSNHLKSLPVHSCNYLAASRRANFSISSQLLKF